MSDPKAESTVLCMGRDDAADEMLAVPDWCYLEWLAVGPGDCGHWAIRPDMERLAAMVDAWRQREDWYRSQRLMQEGRSRPPALLQQMARPAQSMPEGYWLGMSYIDPRCQIDRSVGTIRSITDGVLG